MQKKYFTILLSSLFILWIVFPGINQILSIVPDIESRENRAFASFPDIYLRKLDQVPAKAEDWFNDHFSFRNRLNRLWAGFSVSVLKKSPNFEAIIGKDNCLFMTKKELATYLGQTLLNEEQLLDFKNRILKRSKFLKERNIRYYFVIAPTKYSVYDQYLPSGFRINSGKTQSDQIVDMLKDMEDCELIDLRPLLKKQAEKSDAFLYYKSDNHWNEMGGYLAYLAIIEKVKQDFPDIGIAWPLDSFIIKQDSLKEGNIANLMNMPRLVNEVNPVFSFKNPKVMKGRKRFYPPPEGFPYPYNYEWDDSTNCSACPKALIIRDSFGKNVRKFLSAQFSETVYLFDSWKYKLHPEIIQQEKPDVFIQIGLESYLDHILEYEEDF